MAIKTYKDGTPFTGVIGRTTEEVLAGLAGAAAPPRRRAQRAVLRAGRRRLRAVIQLRRAGRDAGAGQPGGQRPALHQHAHHRLVLAVARLHPDRAQSPSTRAGLDHRDLHRLPRLQRHPALRQGHAQRDAAAEGLQYLLHREVAPDAPRTHHSSRALRPLAARARLRALLRLYGRRNQPVVSRADLRQPRRSSSPNSRRKAIT